MIESYKDVEKIAKSLTPQGWQNIEHSAEEQEIPKPTGNVGVDFILGRGSLKSQESCGGPCEVAH